MGFLMSTVRLGETRSSYVSIRLKCQAEDGRNSIRQFELDLPSSATPTIIMAFAWKAAGLTYGYPSTNSTFTKIDTDTTDTWRSRLASCDDHSRSSPDYKPNGEGKWTCGSPNGRLVSLHREDTNEACRMDPWLTGCVSTEWQTGREQEPGGCERQRDGRKRRRTSTTIDGDLARRVGLGGGICSLA